MPKVLLVEDDDVFITLIVHHLRCHNYVVEISRSGSEGLKRLGSEVFDIAILDWVLPDMLGVDICRNFRTNGGTTPILLLTAKNSSDEKAIGLDSGADDYLVKPFDETELLARLRALMRRATTVPRSILKVRNIQLDTTTYRVTRDNKEIDLAQKEIAILELLMRNPNQRFTAETMLSRLWHSDCNVSVETVRTHIKTLRKKLGDHGDNSAIRTTRHLGYRIIDDDSPSGDDGNGDSE
jgi:DNA-binding response OmpR family regulator